MTVDECRRKMCMREYAAWVYRIGRDRKAKQEAEQEPNRTDYYIMQNTAEIRAIRNGLSKIRTPILLEDLKIPFGEVEETKDKQGKTTPQVYTPTNLPVTAPDFKAWQQQSTKS